MKKEERKKACALFSLSSLALARPPIHALGPLSIHRFSSPLALVATSAQGPGSPAGRKPERRRRERGGRREGKHDSEQRREATPTPTRSRRAHVDWFLARSLARSLFSLPLSPRARASPFFAPNFCASRVEDGFHARQVGAQEAKRGCACRRGTCRAD